MIKNLGKAILFLSLAFLAYVLFAARPMPLPVHGQEMQTNAESAVHIEVRYDFNGDGELQSAPEGKWISIQESGAIGERYKYTDQTGRVTFLAELGRAYLVDSDLGWVSSQNPIVHWKCSGSFLFEQPEQVVTITHCRQVNVFSLFLIQLWNPG